MIVTGLDELFFEQMSNSFNLAPVARIVTSYKDARRIHGWHEDKINNRFNRFSLAYYTVANRHTHFNFSLYVDIVNKKIYAFFDEIEADRMVLDDKELPQCSGEFSIAGFYNEIVKFLSDDFTKAIENYYAGTKFGFDKIIQPDQGLYSLCRFGDVSGFSHFGKQTGFRKLNLAFYPSIEAGRENTKLLQNGYPDYGMLTCNTISLNVAYDISGQYVFITDGTYIWSVKADDFNLFIARYSTAVKEQKCIEKHHFILLEP